MKHYENFPVASFLLPAKYRRAVATVYHFARYADDLADEGDHTAEERLRALHACGKAVSQIAQEPTWEVNPQPDILNQHGKDKTSFLQVPSYQALASVIREYQIPTRLFQDLLSAFCQDVVKKRYANFRELMDYCRRSADPIGRILLHIFGEATQTNLQLADRICSALQLINFWQDIGIDWRKDRIYLPRDEMIRWGVTESEIAKGEVSTRFRSLMQFQVERTKEILYSGTPLGALLPGRIGLEIRAILYGGAKVLEKIQAIDYDVFHSRPILNTMDWPGILWKALWR